MSELPVVNSVANPGVSPVTDPVANLVTDPVTDPVSNLVADPVADPVADWVVIPGVDPQISPGAEPLVSPVAAPVAGPAVDPEVSDFADRPDYEALVRFLLLPFLEDPTALKVDAEFSAARSRVLIRVAFEGEDKGRVFGRGGRNIQAIRTVLEGVAQTAGHSAYLEVFGGGADRDTAKRPPQRAGSPKPVPKLRPKAPEPS
jgi:uncharacterized protein